MPSNDPPVFRARDIGFVYPDGTTGLKGVSFDVPKGDRLALLGANGSGKSTLLRLLSGLSFPTSGTLEAFGKPLTEKALEDDTFSTAFRRRVQPVFQDADTQLFSPTVEEEVAFGPLQLGDASQAAIAVAEALEGMAVSHLRERAPYRLSGGEKRKVAFAAVLVLNPEVLLLDEPMTGLDPRSVGALLDALDDFSEGGGTIVVATHDLPLLREMANRAIVLTEDGGVARDAPVDDILADRPFLESHNLAHIHRHHHGGQIHTHPHEHGWEGTQTS